MSRLFCFKCGKSLNHRVTFGNDEKGKYVEYMCRRCGNITDRHSLEIQNTTSIGGVKQ